MIKKAYQLGGLIYYVAKHGTTLIINDKLASHVKAYESVSNFAHDILRFLKIDVDVSGLENLIPGPAIICMNHTSLLESPALLFFPGRKYFGGKKELFSYPIFGRAIRSVNMIPLDRSNPESARASLNAGAQKIKEFEDSYDAYIVMYPEGTRTKDKDYSMGEFRKGAFYLSKQLSLPIIPIASFGGIGLLSAGSFSLETGTIHLKLLSSLHPEDHDVDGLCEKTRSAISNGIAELKERFG